MRQVMSRRPLRPWAVLAMVIAPALSGCDELPPPAASTAAPTTGAVASSAAATGPSSPNDAAIVTAATAAMDAAEQYTARCWIIDDYYGLDTVDRCWPQGECPAGMVVNVDKNCGYKPGQPEAVVATAKKLEEVSKDASMTVKASVYARLAVLFGESVGTSVKPNAWCIENNDGYGRSECWSTTQGTSARYQQLANAWNEWRSDHKRRVVPQERLYIGGGTSHKVSEKRAAEGFRWGSCPDGPCIVR